MTLRSNSMIRIKGKPRSGKTQVAKNIYCQLPNRRILTFDYSGEHGLSRFPNVLSRSGNYGAYLPHMVNIDDLGFDISEYDLKQDWMSLGISDGAAEFCALIARYSDKHHNNVQTYIQMLEDLPFGDGYIQYFQKKWGIELKGSINKFSYDNLMKNKHKILAIFSQEYQTYNIPALLRRNHAVNINLSLSSDSFFYQREKARLIVGKVLQKLTPYLSELSPVIVFEETDILAPAVKEDEYYSSGDWIRQYVLKLGRRHGCMLIFILQNDMFADPCLVNECDYVIEHSFTGFMQDRGWFSVSDSGSGYKRYFIPDDASSQYEHYPGAV